jgi:cation diffusion facilitator CzcD-associated flavoprotein CzcO
MCLWYVCGCVSRVLRLLTHPPTDIPAHSYQLSFESNLAWTQFYAGAPEILKYWQRVADKYDIRKYMKFGHKCVEARWDERTSKWNVKIQHLDTGKIIEDSADVFMTGIGALNEWKWPDIKGLKDFKGPLLHSANWDENFDGTVCSPFPSIGPG